MKHLASALLSCAVVAAHALPVVDQTPLKGTRLRLGWHTGQSFNSNGQRIRLEGPSVGADIPIFNLPMGTAQISLSPSLIFGGGLRKGKDSDGTLYRLMVTGRFGVPTSNLYGVVGAGISGGQPRGTTKFAKKTRFGTQLGVGMNLNMGMGVTQPFAELSLHMHDTVNRGFLLEVGFRF
ncbi:MAG: hypothetical protein JNM85_10035 [Chthonomonas sp.]|nr:hypothetical protein [Chthonomonas sp.]